MSTAQELIQKLQALPPDSPIMVGIPSPDNPLDVTWLQMRSIGVQRWPGTPSVNCAIMTEPAMLLSITPPPLSESVRAMPQ